MLHGALPQPLRAREVWGGDRERFACLPAFWGLIQRAPTSMLTASAYQSTNRPKTAATFQVSTATKADDARGGGCDSTCVPLRASSLCFIGLCFSSPHPSS